MTNSVRGPEKLANVVGGAVVGSFAGAVLGVLVIGLLAGLATIPQVNWRHSDGMTDLAASTLIVGLILGTFFGAKPGQSLASRPERSWDHDSADSERECSFPRCWIHR